MLPVLLHGLLLATRRRTLQALGQATLVHRAGAGTVCRWLANRRFPVAAWHEYAFARMLDAAARGGGPGPWVVVFDGTDTQRGGLAKIQNTRRPAAAGTGGDRVLRAALADRHRPSTLHLKREVV
jgi:hypothetical protein